MVLCGVGWLVGDQQAGGWVGGLIGWEFFPEFVLCAKVFWVWGNGFVLDLWREKVICERGDGGVSQYEMTRVSFFLSWFHWVITRMVE